MLKSCKLFLEIFEDRKIPTIVDRVCLKFVALLCACVSCFQGGYTSLTFEALEL